MLPRAGVVQLLDAFGVLHLQWAVVGSGHLDGQGYLDGQGWSFCMSMFVTMFSCVFMPVTSNRMLETSDMVRCVQERFSIKESIPMFSHFEIFFDVHSSVHR